VCDIVPERAEAAAAQWGVPGFTDVDTMLREVHPDVVHITLPHYLHASVAIAALKAGCHVLTEKPVAESYGAGVELARVARESGRSLGVCFQNRYNDSSQALRRLVDDRTYGSVLSARASVWWHREASYYAASPWRATWREAGGGVLINQTIHTLDLLCWLLGAPESTSGVAANLTHAGITEVEDTATITMQHMDGVTSVYFADQLPRRERPGGDRAGLRVRDRAAPGRAAARSDPRVVTYRSSRTTSRLRASGRTGEPATPASSRTSTPISARTGRSGSTPTPLW